MTQFGTSWWVFFNIFLFALLTLDLYFLPKRKPKHSLLLACAWVGVAAAFALLLYTVSGKEIALQFTTGYVIEKSLSIDNLFVFLLLFKHFQVPHRWQNKILMYGIIGALVMRLIFIIAGIALVGLIHEVLLVFGAFLVIMGVMMFKKQDDTLSPKEPFLVGLVKKILPFKDTWNVDTFFVRSSGRLFATPAFLVLCTVESTDLLFALDSIPAIFSVTLEPFIVYSANAFAIVGLRSIFFVLKDSLQTFEYLHYGVSLIVIFAGCKMLLAPFYTIDTITSLAVISIILITSLLWRKK